MSEAAGIRSRFFSSLRSHAMSRIAQTAIAFALVPCVLAASLLAFGVFGWGAVGIAFEACLDLGGTVEVASAAE